MKKITRVLSGKVSGAGLKGDTPVPTCPVPSAAEQEAARARKA
jgi:hypothetical protein